MTLLLRTSDQPLDRRPAYRSWCFANGFLTVEVGDELWVDQDARTVTVDRLVTASEPGDPDFPELRRDEHNNPITERQTLPLRVDVPGWAVVQERSERLAA